MKNKHLARDVQEQCFYEFYRQIQYKCQWNNIEFITADRDYQASVNLMRYYELTA